MEALYYLRGLICDSTALALASLHRLVTKIDRRFAQSEAAFVVSGIS